MYGHEVFYQDAMDELAPEAYEFGLKESALNVVAAPAIENVEVTDARTACFTFAVSLYPEVTLGQYKGLEAVKLPVEVTDEEVEAEYAKIAENGGVDAAQAREYMPAEAVREDLAKEKALNVIKEHAVKTDPVPDDEPADASPAAEEAAEEKAGE
jgi:FKBP-type peptidyl-prolyl cis-trans isomerase (trigger factor)